MRQFSDVDQEDPEDGYDSNGKLGPFYDDVNGTGQKLEDAELQVEHVVEVESLGTISVTETPPEVATELLNTLSSEADILAMTVAQLKADLESKKLSRQGNKAALRKRFLVHRGSNNNTQNTLTNGSSTATNGSAARQITPVW